jgi:hypothetical protein
MCDYCDRKLCKQRKYGVGRERGGYVSDVEFGKIVVVRAANPYFILEARVAGTEEYTQVVLKGGTDLLNQRAVQSACIEYLGRIPITIKQQAWEVRMNECLAIKEVVNVGEATDMSSAASLKRQFYEYLTHNQSANNSAFVVKLGLVYRKATTYYFSADGFKDYIKDTKIDLRDLNLRNELLDYGCVEGRIECKTQSGKTVVIDCWQKEADERLSESEEFFEGVVTEYSNAVSQSAVSNEEDKSRPEIEDDEDTGF